MPVVIRRPEKREDQHMVLLEWHIDGKTDRKKMERNRNREGKERIGEKIE